MCEICDEADAQLLKLHLEGNGDAFPTLYRRHEQRLHALARSIAGAEAEDAVQEAMAAAHRYADRFRGHSKVSTWLHRIVINAATDLVRRRRETTTAEPPDPGYVQRTGLDWQELRHIARTALTPDQERAILLVDAMEYPIAEAAAILGIAEGTLKSRCARGRARMAQRLSAAESGHEKAHPERRLPKPRETRGGRLKRRSVPSSPVLPRTPRPDSSGPG